MLDPKVMETWLRLTAEAARGAGEAREAVKSLGEAPTTPDELVRWWGRFMPPGVDLTKPEQFEAWLEQWWRALGVVPRSRYLELLERYEGLRTRLEEAEATIQRLRTTLGQGGRQEEARKILDVWESTLQGTLEAQAEWMRAWTSQHGKGDRSTDDSTERGGGP